MKQTRRRYLNREEREEILAEYVESGLSQGKFCEERGIGMSTMQYWLRKAREAEEGDEESAGSGGFVEVQVEDREMILPGWERRPETARYELVLRDGKRLLVGSGFETNEVAKLLEERGPVYTAVATLSVDTNGRTPDDVAAEIIRRLEEN